MPSAICQFTFCFSAVFGEFPKIRDAQIFRAFREARPIRYLLLLLFKAPNLIGAIGLYLCAAVVQRRCGLWSDVGVSACDFPCSCLTAAVSCRRIVALDGVVPEFPEVGVFSLIMHTFFVCCNAAIGVVFLPKANAELFDKEAA